MNPLLNFQNLYNLQSASNLSLYMAGYIIFDFLCIIGGLTWPYLFCYFATRTTNRVLTIGNSVYDLDWYEYSADLQKYIILIIARSQKNVHFSGFSVVGCTLVVFGQVRNSQDILFEFLDCNDIF